MPIELLAKGFQLIIGKSKEVVQNPQISGKEVGFFSQIFGCWHERLTRPFFEGKTAYRSCLKCGARKRFDPQTMKTYGKYYYPSVEKTTEN